MARDPFQLESCVQDSFTLNAWVPGEPVHLWHMLSSMLLLLLLTRQHHHISSLKPQHADSM